MKIRTDFVTNSSSSSFVTVSIRTKKGDIIEFDSEGILTDELPYVKGGKLYKYDNVKEKNVELKTVSELAACLYFSDSDYYPVDIATVIIKFLCGKLSARELKSSLVNFEGLEELDDVNPNDYDDDSEFSEALWNTCIELLEDKYTWDLYSENNSSDLEPYIKLVENVPELSDIQCISFGEYESYNGESMESYIDLFATSDKQTEFESDCKKPITPEMLKKWADIIEIFWETHNFCSATDSAEQLAEEALETKDFFRLIPDSYSTESKTTFDFSKLTG